MSYEYFLDIPSVTRTMNNQQNIHNTFYRLFKKKTFPSFFTETLKIT